MKYTKEQIHSIIVSTYRSDKQYFKISTAEYKNLLNISQLQINLATEVFKNELKRITDKHDFVFVSSEKQLKNGTLAFKYNDHIYDLYYRCN